MNTSENCKTREEINEAFTVCRPTEDDLIPLVVDSPHSSTLLPTDINSIVPKRTLLTGWDAFVDEIWSAVPGVGGSLLCANFHRVYIDPNRSLLDIDQTMLERPWPTLTSLSGPGRRGMGLIRRDALPDMPMYIRKLSVAEVNHRIERYYKPYHSRLTDLVDLALASYGQVWHIDCHSMKSRGNAMNIDNGEPRPDLVISDDDGATADPAFTAWVAQWWRGAGYHVNVNHPYKGGEIVKQIGRPSLNRHSIQIEMNRALYMNEATFEKTEGFDRLASDTSAFLLELRAFIFKKLSTAGVLQPATN